MRKSKKLLGIALVPCMVGSLLAGCTASSDTDATSVTTAGDQQEETTADTTEENTESAETTVPDETEETTEESAGQDGQAAAFVDLLKGVSDMEAYRMNTVITVNEKTEVDGEDDEESEVTLNIEALTDGKGNVSVTVGADYADEESGISINGDLLTISKVDDRVYLDLTGTYDAVMDALGEDSKYIEQYVSAFDLTMDEVEELLVLGIPVGDLDISKNTYADMEKALNLIYDDMAVAIDSLGEDFLVQDGNTYILTANNDNLIAVADAFVDAFEGNIGDIYDAYVEAMKKTDYSDQIETVAKAVVNEVIKGIEAATETELGEDDRAEVEEEIQSALEAYKTSMEEAVQELEDGKDEFIEEFNSTVKEYKDAKEDIQSELADSDNTIDAVLKLTSEGEEGARTLTCEFTASAKTTETYYADYDEDQDPDEATAPDETTYVTITVKSVVEEGDVEITAPEKYAPLSQVVELAYRVYTIYEEMSQGDDDYDDYDDDDDDWNTETYTQAELAEIYDVTLKQNQAIASYSTDLDAVLITAYDDMEFYEPDDMDNYQMEVNEDADVLINVVVYDSSFSAEYVQDAYEGKVLDDNMYYIEEDDNELVLFIFEDDITIYIDLEVYADGGVEAYTNGDGEAFMKSLVELCEIIPAK
jgi:hypothetical protein